LHSYDDRWAINFQRHHRDFDSVGHLRSYYRPLRSQVHTVDIVHPSAPLDGYRLLVAPHLNLLDAELGARLYDFVHHGGHLVLGPRSGMKDESNALLPLRQPGPLAPVLGAHVEEYYALDANVPLEPGGEAHTWAEWLEADQPDVEVLLHYAHANGWIDGKPAVVSRSVGSGRISYVGAWLDDHTMQRLTLDWLANSGVQPISAPEGVELCRRVGATGEVWIVINHTRQTRTVPRPAPARDFVTGQTAEPDLNLDGYGVAVLASE
jgi:beta-galactosidase